MDLVQRLDHLANVLRLFSYERMASAVPLLSDSWMLTMSPDPVTVFAVPDDSLEAACPGWPPSSPCDQATSAWVVLLLKALFVALHEAPYSGVWLLHVV